MSSNHFILCHPLLLLPSVFPSIRVFSNESTLCLRGPKYWSFSTCPSNEYSVLIFFRIDWLDISAVQGTLKSLFQHHSLVQFSRSVISDSLQPHELQHIRLPCPSATPGPCSNSCPLSQWCHPTISSSVIPFSFCLQSFPGSESFPMSQLFTPGGQSIGVSASTSVLPMTLQEWFPLGLTGSVALHSQESSLTTQFENIKSWALSLLYGPTLTSAHDYWKNHGFD